MAVIYTSQEVKDGLPVRHPTDYYPTPRQLVDEVIGRCVLYDGRGRQRRVLDPGAGSGVWGEAWRATELGRDDYITGVELLADFKRHKDYDDWLVGDFLSWEPSFLYDVVIGNPPYGVVRNLAEKFVRKGLDSLREGGQLIFLLRTEFQNGSGRAKGLFTEYPPYGIYPCAQRPSFRGDGGTQPQDYTIYHWVKGHKGAALWRPLSWRE
jgi:hypothetical protein